MDMPNLSTLQLSGESLEILPGWTAGHRWRRRSGFWDDPGSPSHVTSMVPSSRILLLQTPGIVQDCQLYPFVTARRYASIHKSSHIISYPMGAHGYLLPFVTQALQDKRGLMGAP